MLDLLLNAVALVAVVAALFVWVWVMPGILLGSRPWRRTRARLARAASASVNGPLTRPRRPLPPRPAGPPLRIERSERDRSRELMLLGPGMEFTLTPAHSFDALVQLTAGRPPAAAPVTSWAPAVIAAMPSTRCDACPAWGCPAKGADPECADQERNAPAVYPPSRYVPRADRLPVTAQRLRFRVAMLQARAAQPSDDEIANPSRDVFDAHTPTPPPDPGVTRTAGRVRPVTLEDLIRDGLDVDALPPGTVVLLRCRHHLDAEQMHRLADEARAVFDSCGIEGAVVSADLDVIALPPAAGDPNGNPAAAEIRR